MAKTILITGATSGIGTYLSHHFAQRGCELILHGRDAKKLAALAKSIKSSKVTCVEANLGSLEDIDRMFKQIGRRVQSIDVLINNAFGKLESELVESKPADIAEFFQVSMTGTAEVIRQSVPFLRKARPSHVINIVADWGFPMHNIMTGPSAYIAGKYGIHGLGAALQTEIAPQGILTTNICPGVVAAGAKFLANKKLEHRDKKSIHPADLANAIDFVLGQATSHVRSVVLSPVDPKYNGL